MVIMLKTLQRNPYKYLIKEKNEQEEAKGTKKKQPLPYLIMLRIFLLSRKSKRIHMNFKFST